MKVRVTQTDSRFWQIDLEDGRSWNAGNGRSEHQGKTFMRVKFYKWLKGFDKLFAPGEFVEFDDSGVFPPKAEAKRVPAKVREQAAENAKKRTTVTCPECHDAYTWIGDHSEKRCYVCRTCGVEMTVAVREASAV